MSIDELLLHIVGDDPNALAPRLRQWMSTSRRFRTFTEQYQTKIRSKLRSTHERESLQDLLLELEIAHWLLQEKRFQVIYEGLGLRTTPAPDFTIHFTTKTHFHVEVTRIWPVALEPDHTLATAESDTRKVVYVILGKLGQLKAGASNVLVIGLTANRTDGIQLDEGMKRLKRQIEAGEPGLLARSHLSTPTAFFKQYQSLSAVLFYTTSQAPSTLPAGPTALLWLNKEAKYPLLPQVQTIFRQLAGNGI